MEKHNLNKIDLSITVKIKIKSCIKDNCNNYFLIATNCIQFLSTKKVLTFFKYMENKIKGKNVISNKSVSFF